MQFSHARKRRPVVNIVPLLDILAIILIFLVVTTVFKKEEPIVEIKLPETTEAKPAEKQPPTILYVTKTKAIFLDTQQVTLNELTLLLEKKRKQDSTFWPAMKADKEAPFGLILQVMEATRKAGFQDLPTFTENTPRSS